MRCWQSRGSQDRIRHLGLLHSRKLPLKSSSLHMSRMTRADMFRCDVGGFQGSPYVGESTDRQKNQGQGVGCETEAKPRLQVNRSRVAYRNVWDREKVYGHDRRLEKCFGRLNRSRVAYRDVRDQEKMCGHDRMLGKCFGRSRKHPHMIRVLKVLENPGHTPAAENSGSC